MANAKISDDNAKNEKKLFDVAKPGKSAPAPTSRPVIVTNRPLMKDPMVVDSIPDAPGAPSVLPSRAAKKIEVRPHQEDEATPEPDSESNDSEATEEATSTPEPAPDQSKPAEEAGPDPAEKKKPEEPPTEEQESEAEPVEAEEPKSEPAKDADDPEPSGEDETPPAGGKKAARNIAQDQDEAARAEEAHRKQIEELVASHEYFLPINAVAKRRSKRHAIIGALLIILLILAWLDIALDAGLLHIDGINPITHFFSYS